MGGREVDRRTGLYKLRDVYPLGLKQLDLSPPPTSRPQGPLVTCVAETGHRHPRSLSTGRVRFFGRKHISPGSNLRSKCVRISCQALDQISINLCSTTSVVSVDGIILNNHQPIPLSEGTHDCTVEDIKFRLIVEFSEVEE